MCIQGMHMGIVEKTKSAGLRLRLERNLRQDFLEACRADGRIAAEVLREFMRDYIEHTRGSAQSDMFGPPPRSMSMRQIVARRGKVQLDLQR